MGTVPHDLSAVFLMRARPLALVACLAIAVGALAYLRDPPWIGSITSGFRSWEEDPPGTRWRWTAGRASFFVPSDATSLTLPVRALFPVPNGEPVVVHVSVDDRFLTDVVLTDGEAWARPLIPLPRRPNGRRYRRVDLHVSRTIGPFILGVQTGEATLERAGSAR
jgi:hypothetical protein